MFNLFSWCKRKFILDSFSNKPGWVNKYDCASGIENAVFFRSLVIKQLFCISSLLVVVVPITYLEIQQGDVCFMFFQVLLCQKRIKEQHEKDKRIYANMFQKFAERDSKVMDLFTKTATRGCDKHNFRFGKK